MNAVHYFLIFFVAVDLPLTILMFGFYSPDWFFHPDLIAEQYAFESYTSSPLDFVVLALIRAALLMALCFHLWYSDRIVNVLEANLERAHGDWFGFSLAIVALSGNARVFIPAFTGRVLAEITQSGGMAALVRSVTLMSLLALSSTIFGGLRGGTFTYASALVSRQIKLDLFRSLVKQEIAFFDTTKSANYSTALTVGETVSRLSSDCQVMASNVSTHVNKLSEETQTTIAKANNKAEEVLGSMRTVRSFACEMFEAKAFEENLDVTLKVNKKKSLAYMGYTWNNEFNQNGVLIAVLCYGGHLVMTDNLTAASLLTFLLYQIQLGENVYVSGVWLGFVIAGIMDCVGSSRKEWVVLSHRRWSGDRSVMPLNVEGSDVPCTEESAGPIH
ncbi:hypothetical protein ANCDUO_14973 [Ancylostoma duodenale]|uniref:ABC transmembrane type-1 domain-containing protein n=1 Tax=Ancylostoma duodenale TaxID=51022 RepID=A0A0C2CYJ6_9BILA|nr:hypothetical protein ANCDUO_14973 [Ancylostoma duodenale]